MNDKPILKRADDFVCAKWNLGEATKLNGTTLRYFMADFATQETQRLTAENTELARKVGVLTAENHQLQVDKRLLRVRLGLDDDE